MKEIKWEESIYDGDFFYDIGNIFLCCSPESSRWCGKSQEVVIIPGTRWYSSVRLGSCDIVRYGPYRKTLSKCKEDAIKMAIQLMDDMETIHDEQVRAFEKVMGL